MTNNKDSARETDRGAKAGAPPQPTAVEERVKQFVMDYVQCSSIKPTEEELAVITEKAKVWEIWDRLRSAYLPES